MLDRQQHRGPDHRGTWAKADTALGLDRLSILDLSENGEQPFLAPDGAGALAYNGEVYNWRQLRKELAGEGVRFASDCDTEVVLHALHRWGPTRAIPRFNGMFALAWRDLRDDTLWLARDRMGIKPLYYAECADAVVFASEIKSLFAHPSVVCRPDMHALVTQVLNNRLVGSWTPFEGVRMVLPGSMLCITGKGTAETKWFDVERDLDVERILRAESLPFAQQASAFTKLLENSVESHLQSDAPLAVMCSGGLDSSLTTALAVRHKPGLVAYVAEAEGLTISEADKAQKVADHLGVELRRIQIADADIPDLWTRAVWHNDQPLFFHQNPLAMRVCEAVRDDGFKVLVTGEGSDELFGGYSWLNTTQRMWQRRELHNRVWPNIRPLRWLGRWAKWAKPTDLLDAAKDPFTLDAQRGRQPAFTSLVVDAGMRQDRARSLFAKLEPIRSHSERAYLARGMDDIYHHLRVLLAAKDKMAMSASIEARVPFLESSVIDFGLHLNASAKGYGRAAKPIVKAAAEGLLPSDIIHARKIGFSVPPKFYKGYEAILEGGLVAEFFKWSAEGREQRQRVMKSKPQDTRQLMSMELWAQLYFNGAKPAELAERLRSVRRVS